MDSDDTPKSDLVREITVLRAEKIAPRLHSSRCAIIKIVVDFAAPGGRAAPQAPEDAHSASSAAS